MCHIRSVTEGVRGTKARGHTPVMNEILQRVRIHGAQVIHHSHRLQRHELTWLVLRCHVRHVLPTAATCRYGGAGCALLFLTPRCAPGV